MVVPDQGYLKAAQELLHEHRALLIADEVQTGCARTGKMLACDHDPVGCCRNAARSGRAATFGVYARARHPCAGLVAALLWCSCFVSRLLNCSRACCCKRPRPGSSRRLPCNRLFLEQHDDMLPQQTHFSLLGQVRPDLLVLGKALSGGIRILSFTHHT